MHTGPPASFFDRGSHPTREDGTDDHGHRDRQDLGDSGHDLDGRQERDRDENDGPTEKHCEGELHHAVAAEAEHSQRDRPHDQEREIEPDETEVRVRQGATSTRFASGPSPISRTTLTPRDSEGSW